MSYKGPRCECGSTKPRCTEACQRCTTAEHARHAADSVSDRIANWLRREGDWVMASDIADSLDIRRTVTSSRLAYMAENGTIEQRWEKGMGMVYRLRRRAA